MVPALLLWLAGLAGLASLSSPAVLVQSQRTCEVHEKCVPLPDCKPLLRLVSHQGRKPSDEEKALLRASQCGWSPTSTYLPLVCCDLVPWGKCGDTAVHGQDLNGPALAGEFPWMARLVYRGAIDSADGAEHLSLDGCAASLISDRYLLTAARCVVGRDPPAYARLGDLGAGQDCGANANASECAAAFNAAVDDVIAHPEYVADTPGHEHDIALVKLKTGVRFSGAVAPVCLPIADPHAEAARNDRPLTTLGWGSLGSLHRANSNKTERLTKSVLKEVPHEFCAEKYKGTSDQVDGVHQMCARGSAEGSHACHGDPGAPLTSVATSKGAQRAILEGVASFGTAACASDGMPAVFSRVSTYLPWIMTNIRLA